MPNLTEFLNIDIPKTNNKQSSIPRISEINLPQNKWYYQFEKKPTIGAAGTLRPKRPKLKVGIYHQRCGGGLKGLALP